MPTISEYRSTDTNMIFADVQMLANQLMFEHGLLDLGWYVNFDRAKKRLGQCNHNTKTITLSKYLIPSCTFDQNKNTILHEIAHALVGPGHGHSAVWETKALEIGCNGNRCGQVGEGDVTERPTARWHAECPTCKVRTVEGFHRAPGRVRSCTSCSPGKFSFEHVMVWFEWGTPVDHMNMNTKYANEYQNLMWRVVLVEPNV